MTQERKSLEGVVLLFVVLFFLVIALHFLAINDIFSFKQFNILSLKHKGILVIRFIFFVSLGLLIYLTPVRIFKGDPPLRVKLYWLAAFTFFFFFSLLGYTRFSFYNLFIYPIVFFAAQITLIFSLSLFSKKVLKEDRFFKGVSCLPPDVPDFFFDLQTDEGILRIHKPAENIFIDGGPGSGKSHYLIKHFIKQACEREYAGLIYDYEGDPLSPGSPILSSIAYSSIIEAKKQFPNHKLKFAFINFTDMSRTSRVNILSTRYYTPSNAKLFINTLAQTIMKNLEPSWREKSDFWSANAINFVSSVMYLLYKNYSDKGYNTLPHAISICLSPVDDIFNWLTKDEEMDKTMAPMISAWKLQAQQQTAGAVSSAQLPLVNLYNPYIYWVLSADELSLDITNKDNPTLLCLGNCPEITPATSPAISSIISVIMGQMNNPGKQKSIFCVDELPRINITNLDGFIATARKHNVSIVLAIQDYHQLVRDYGEKSASTIKASCGTYFQGKTGNYKTAEDLSRAIGEIKKVTQSISQQLTDSGGSFSESYTKERVLQAREIASQNSGHFFVQVSNGNPPFSYTNFQPFHLVAPKSHKIPPFGYTVKADNEEVQKTILEAEVRANFKKIEKEARDILLGNV